MQMILMNDVLKASKGIHVDDTFAELWGRKLSNAYTVDTYSGTLPATLTGTKVGYLKSYKIYGDSVQDGTPTPENPIMPSGCGEMETTGAHAGQYKLPILSNSTVTDIYLGESQTMRRIKRLVLTGTDAEGTWKASPTRTGSFYLNVGTNGIIKESICDRATNVKLLDDYHYGNIYVEKTGASLLVNLWLFDTAITVEDFKAYLASEYSAGTPVTVWYVLAEPETVVLNEPLMKIGDYADTIDSTQTSVQIPTASRHYGH